MENGAIYLRVSSERQGQDDKWSLSDQRKLCMEYAAENEITIQPHHVYVEKHSGADYFHRPELSRLRQAMAQRQLDYVIVAVYDRLTRDPDHMGAFHSEAAHYNVSVVSVTEPVDNSSEGALIRHFKAYGAKEERRAMIKRTVGGRRDRAFSDKLPVTGSRTFGYDFTDDRKVAYVINEEEAEWVRTAFDKAAAGVSLRKITKALNDAGIRPLRGTVWNAGVVGNMIRNDTYKGDVYTFKTTNFKDPLTGRRKVIPKPRSEWIKSAYRAPVIIDEELWDAANAGVSDDKKFRPKEGAPEHGLMLAGYRQAVCGTCGTQMLRIIRKEQRPTKDDPDRVIYRDLYQHHKVAADRHGCSAFVLAKSTVDDHVWRKVVELISNPEVLETELERYNQSDPTQFDRASLERRIAEVTQTHEKSVKSFAVTAGDLDEFTRALLVKELRELAEQRERLNGELAKLQQRHDMWSQGQRNLDGLRANIEAIAERIHEDAPLAVRRSMMTAFGVTVKMFPKGHQPNYVMEIGIGEGITLSDDELVPDQGVLTLTGAT